MISAPVRGPRRNIAITFGMKKSRMVWLPDSKKIEDMFTHVDTIHESDGRTDGWADRRTDAVRRQGRSPVF